MPEVKLYRTIHGDLVITTPEGLEAINKIPLRRLNGDIWGDWEKKGQNHAIP